MAEQSSISSFFTYGWTYDVFLNFRGKDTRFGFTRNLYEALHRKGIHTFIDDEGLRKGEAITPSLVKAIQESRIAITIFSKNYSSSTFCLDELVHILECIKKKGRLVLPIFYDVDPSEVRHQRENYEEAFAKHEERFENDEEKVQKWRLALQDVANLSGHHFKPGEEYECHFIEQIVKEISRRIDHRPFHIANYPVGLESRVLKVNALLEVGSNEGVQMVGIVGIGGIGKTTIARAVCNLIADSFEGFCFLPNVRENSTKNGLEYLQEWLLSELVGEYIKIKDVTRGIPIVKHRLQRKTVLLVLDDVDKIKQLQAIAGGVDWFGTGSKIIITTRNKHLLVRHNVERINEVESLNQEEALELLRWNAFRQNRVDPSYMDNLNNVVLYADGLPLAIEVIGSNLFSRGINEWNSALDNYRRIPNKEIQQVLKISYDALEEFEQEIFLDIACCFKGDDIEYVTRALYARGICPDYAIKMLVDKCLIKMDSSHVTMHDLIQDMGKEIVRQQSPNEPGNRTRLWFHEDILEVLKENKGTGKIEAINLDMPEDKMVDWSGRAFKKMPNLKILIIRNASFSIGPKYLPNSLRVLEWKGCPSPSFPSDFNPKELIILKMTESCFKLHEQLKKFQSVSVMDFRRCEFLRRVPDLSGVPNLKEIWLEGCKNLIEVHDSIGFLGKLKKLSLKECDRLETFPNICLRSLEFLDLSGCKSLQMFPEILGKMEDLIAVNLDYSGIEKLPFSFKELIEEQDLVLLSCSHHSGSRTKQARKKLKSSIVEWHSHLRSMKSRNVFLDQALLEDYGLKFISEGGTSRLWFDHYEGGDLVSFWIRNEFPNMAVCFAVEIVDIYQELPELHIGVRINGIDIGFPYKEKINASQHIFLYDLQRLVPEGKLNHVALGLEWNHVEISCFLDFKNYYAKAADKRCGTGRVKWSGIHVYRQTSRREDISFYKP